MYLCFDTASEIYCEFIDCTYNTGTDFVQFQAIFPRNVVENLPNPFHFVHNKLSKVECVSSKTVHNNTYK